jgi:hypothetical protein
MKIVGVSGCLRNPPAQREAPCIRAEQAGWRERVEWWRQFPGSITIMILTLEPYKSLAEAQEYPDGMARSEGCAGDIRWNIDGPPWVALVYTSVSAMMEQWGPYQAQRWRRCSRTRSSVPL